MLPQEVLASLPTSEVNRQLYDVRPWRDLLLNWSYLESSAKSFQRNSSTSKTWTSLKRYVTHHTIQPSGRVLTHIYQVYIRPLRNANPPIIRDGVGGFIKEVFGNILDLRECNRHLLKTMTKRQGEEGGVIFRIGDAFLDAATEFRSVYPVYIWQMQGAERRLKEEIENNGALRMFLEVPSGFSWKCCQQLKANPPHYQAMLPPSGQREQNGPQALA